MDAIIAQGVEAGGHRGMFLSDAVATQIGTLALVPQIADAVIHIEPPPAERKIDKPPSSSGIRPFRPRAS